MSKRTKRQNKRPTGPEILRAILKVREVFGHRRAEECAAATLQKWKAQQAETTMSLEMYAFAETGNGAHAWAAYDAWREIARHRGRAPPLPEQVLTYFDGVASGLQQLRGTEALGRLLKISGKDRGRGGGPSGAALAALQRKAESVQTEFSIQFLRATNYGKSALPRGAMQRIYAEVARLERMTVNAVKTMATRRRFLDAALRTAQLYREADEAMSPAEKRRMKARAARAVAREIAVVRTLQNSESSPTK